MANQSGAWKGRTIDDCRHFASDWAVDIAGRGAQPYLQFPWSWELRDGWSLSGMFTEFFRPIDPTTKGITEATFVIEKKLTDKTSVFTEYAGYYPEGVSPKQLFNSGVLYHLTPTQQLDFRFAIGLNHNSPSYIVGLGYSVRFDRLFQQSPIWAIGW
jgi:Putative MetA-pathway of phenol degradation